MKECFKKYSNLKKHKIVANSRKLISYNTTEYNIKPKFFYKSDKLKKEIKVKDNITTKNNPSIKAFNLIENKSKNIYCKKRANSYYDDDKTNSSNKDTIVSKKFITNNKSYNNINNKIIKQKVSRNQNNFFGNFTSNNKLRKKILFNAKNNSNKNTNEKFINDIELSGLNNIKFKNIYFNTILDNENNKNRKKKDNYFSLSQSFGNKKNNALKKKINSPTTEIYNDDKNKFITETGKECKNTNFFIKKSKYSFDINNLEINDFSDSNFNKNNVNINNETCFSKNEKTLSNNISQNRYQPLQLYNDTTTINLGGSYNFHQYFNTIINNKNNENAYNSSQKTNSIYNKSPTNNNKLIPHIFKKNSEKTIYFNTQLNSNENKKKDCTNNIFYNEKLLKEIKDIKNEMNQNLKQNPTNSKSKKYNTLKHSFEKLLKIINNYFFNKFEFNPVFDFLQNLFIGYHDVVTAYSTENLNLKELNYKLTEQYEKIDKNLLECNKIIKEKQKNIESLENKLNELVFNMKSKNIIREYHINMKEFDLKKKDDQQNNKIQKINERNLDDLDALYFFDKIETRHQRAFSGGKLIPTLPINKRKIFI